MPTLPPETSAVHVLQSELERISARIRACGRPPFDPSLVAELTTLRFDATRLGRRLRLLDGGAGAVELRCVEAGSRLRNELRDARSEAARRGILLALQFDELATATPDRKVIDSLAALVEDGVEAGASYLSMEIRLRAGGSTREVAGSSTMIVTLTTDAALHDSAFSVLMLRALVRHRVQRGAACSLQVAASPSDFSAVELELSYDLTHALEATHHEASRWASPSRI